MFLLVPAYPGCPGSKAVKQSLLLLLLLFWYWPTWVVPEKGPLNVCVCVCVCVLTGRLDLLGDLDAAFVEYQFVRGRASISHPVRHARPRLNTAAVARCLALARMLHVI